MSFFYAQTEAELLLRAKSMAGKTIFELANEHHIIVPPNLKRNKGWIGQLMEFYLGAHAGNQALPDFLNLDIELKTLPITADFVPLETTFISFAPLLNRDRPIWERSSVYRKLKKVLWIPIIGAKTQLFSEKIIGDPILHSLTDFENEQLKQDWLELTEMIHLGQIEHIRAHFGDYLQLRPKAANGKSLTQALNKNGDLIYTRPRGFYLRKNFTSQLFKR